MPDINPSIGNPEIVKNNLYNHIVHGQPPTFEGIVEGISGPNLKSIIRTLGQEGLKVASPEATQRYQDLCTHADRDTVLDDYGPTKSGRVIGDGVYGRDKARVGKNAAFRASGDH